MLCTCLANSTVALNQPEIIPMCIKHIIYTLSLHHTVFITLTTRNSSEDEIPECDERTDERTDAFAIAIGCSSLV